MSTRQRSGATSSDVAALAGVSQSAVSRAFTPGSSLAEEKRLRIVEAAKKLNYVPNSIARSLTTRRSNIVAVILGNTANPFYLQVLEAFILRLQGQGRQVLTFTVPNGGDSDEAILRVLRYQVDGVILTSAQLSTRMVSLCHDRGIPVVLFNRYIPGSDASGVRCANAEGGRLIAEAFLAAGARTFAMIHGDPKGTTSQDRARGFVDKLAEAGIARSAITSLEGHSVYDGAFNAVSRHYRDGKAKLPDAIFGINDIMAMGAIDALGQRFGLKVPDDVMIGGFDDIAEGRRFPYRLTTVRQPIDTMVEKALDILHLDEPLRPIQPGIDVQVPGRLIWRQSIPAPRSRTPDGAA
ncbi:LacI family DNA-binding transcriptional regulator [Jiella mangrovi]|uniref:LacI family DNA-binding transcriptional regulator n=1 Tax=Jiella mangrovi TaxID=2821407 RepID=A0ABS4BMG1_9HYPH|nr:LacI family DNA-binding transcriptional regulator [Jiella mangrovi]MBP0617406.1 LacI family DNA-binding transcriptional regulator [Jiella mangrovi]